MDFDSARVNLMTVLVVAWGVRLTYNFARKGGYKKGGEDYRWAHVREQMSPAAFQVRMGAVDEPGLHRAYAALHSVPAHDRINLR